MKWQKKETKQTNLQTNKEKRNQQAKRNINKKVSIYEQETMVSWSKHRTHKKKIKQQFPWYSFWTRFAASHMTITGINIFMD
jgi:hypothetical protein